MSNLQSFQTKAYEAHLHRTTRPLYSYNTPLRSGDWEGWRAAFRTALSELLGLDRIRAGSTGLGVRSRQTEWAREAGYTLEKGYIVTEPGIEIPYYLLIPDTGQGPYPLVLTPHGHNRRGKETYVGRYEDEQEKSFALEGDRDIALQAVAEGYAVLAPDVRGFWEMARAEDLAAGKIKSCEELQRRALMYGRTLIGERVHDLGVLIDFAETRKEIDTSAVIVTGNSGGGTVALFAAALDLRITMAIPGSYFCTFRDSIVSLTHCACNIIPGVMELGEMYDIAGLVAGRPMLIVHGLDDEIYPIGGTRQAFEHLHRQYAAQGIPERCELYVGHGGHRYYKERVWHFVREHLANR